jgi:glutamine cyclotransferase
MVRYLVPTALFLFLYACNGSDTNNNDRQSSDNNPAPLVLSYNIVKVYPHDTSAYTEGLVWYNNLLYESTGTNGKSKLRKVNLENGKAIKEVKLDSIYFGEGIAIINNKIYQLTWQEHKLFVYDATTLEKIKEMNWPFEGWGMTTNGKELIIGTGTSNLYFVNPDDLKIIRTISVTDNYGPVGNINELEYVKGFIYSNQYLTNNILKIDPESGKVLAKLDASSILDKSGIVHNPAQYDLNSGNVLNGIAYDSAKNSLLITGKMWPALFEIKLDM